MWTTLLFVGRTSGTIYFFYILKIDQTIEVLFDPYNVEYIIFPTQYSLNYNRTFPFLLSYFL